jgi:hypothetical protein
VSLAVLAALFLLGAEPAPPEARQLKEAGDRKRAAGDAEGAREAYLAAVAVFGGYAEAHEALGEVLFSESTNCISLMMCLMGFCSSSCSLIIVSIAGRSGTV